MNLDAVMAYDFHCHIDLFPDYLAIIEECQSKRVLTLAVTNAPRVWVAMRKLIHENNRYILPALGYHPQLIGTNEDNFGLFVDLFNSAKYIGEVGLDGSNDYESTYHNQRSAFKNILAMCSEAGKKIVSVHSRNASKDVVQLIRDSKAYKNNTLILHWFTGELEHALSAAEFGCYFSINERMLQTAKGLTLVKSLPSNLILTETDGPFTKSRPPEVLQVMQLLTRCMSMTVAEIRTILAKNAQAVLSAVPNQKYGNN